MAPSTQGCVLEDGPVAGTILDNPEADGAFGSEYRQGWTL
jgi:hypothetical protein